MRRVRGPIHERFVMGREANSDSGGAVEQSRTPFSLPLRMEIAVLKKLLPALGLFAFIAGPVMAADAPPASTPPAASAHKSTHKASAHHVHHHHKKPTKTS